jgi:predicted RNase H-like nuclease
MGRLLVVGFDSAWTRAKVGAVVGAQIDERGTLHELGQPQLVRYQEATEIIRHWQTAHAPLSTLVLLDQPTIVANDSGQRPVEHIVCSTISRRRGGMQPANKGRVDMFGAAAPVWEFLAGFGGLVDPLADDASTQVLETYPALAMIALGWTLPDSQRATGRLPKYNPDRRKTFAIADWVHVCRATGAKLAAEGAIELAAWTEAAATKTKPTKNDQDRLDACLCLVAALHLAKGRNALFVGCCTTGYIVVPNSDPLRAELVTRCMELGRDPSQWVRVFRRAVGSAGTVPDASNRPTGIAATVGGFRRANGRSPRSSGTTGCARYRAILERSR